MCLSSVSSKLVWNKEEQDFVGFGYKAYTKNMFDSIGRIKNTAINRGVKLSKSKWMEAKVNNYNNDYTLASDSGIRYFPGFHIFDELDAAKAYGMYYQGIGFKVVQVMYKNIIAIGTNYAGIGETKKCIVAKNMKIVGVVYNG